jgi:glycosyltransferase involved in cell wall biosynthesis
MEQQSKPTISVNIPIFNGEKTIARAVKSILSQSFTDFELVVINDCSKDSTPQILNEFSDPRIRIIHHEQNRGISRTRNHLLQSSNGRYIAVLDGDDFALPHRLKTQIETMQSDPSLDGVFSSVLTYKDQDPYDTLPGHCSGKEPSQMRETLLFESVFPHSTAFLSKEVFGNGYREDLSCAEDYAKWLELVFEGKMLRTLPKPVSHTWCHSPTHYTREKMRTNVMKLQNHYFEKLLGRPLTDLEMVSQWALYETVEWSPASGSEALAQLTNIEKWISTLGQLEFNDKNMDRALFRRGAQRRLYQLCSKAVQLLGFRAMRFTHGLPLDQRLKLLAKSLLTRVQA